MKGRWRRASVAAPARFVALALALALPLALGTSGCKRREKAGLIIAGSTSVQPFAEKWAEVYHHLHPELEINVQGGGSTAGVQATLSGAAGVGMCSRELKPDEAEKLRGIIVARDGLTVIVHPDNPLRDLSVDAVRRIFAGEVRSWRELGGPDRGINVVTRENGSGARGAFQELVMKKQRIVASALVQDSQGAVRQMVSSDPAAIGYVSHGVVDASVKPLTIDGVAASAETVASHAYPLVRPFLFLVAGAPSPAAQGFIDWVLGPEGQALAKKEGLFPVQ